MQQNRHLIPCDESAVLNALPPKRTNRYNNLPIIFGQRLNALVNYAKTMAHAKLAKEFLL